MATAKDLTDTLIFRAKNLVEFECQTEVPENFSFNGIIPFDMSIKNNIITAKIWAIDTKEAARKLAEYLESCRDD